MRAENTFTQNSVVKNHIDNLSRANFYGTLELKFEDGKICLIREIRNRLPNQLIAEQTVGDLARQGGAR